MPAEVIRRAWHLVNAILEALLRIERKIEMTAQQMSADWQTLKQDIASLAQRQADLFARYKAAVEAGADQTVLDGIDADMQAAHQTIQQTLTSSDPTLAQPVPSAGATGATGTAAGGTAPAPATGTAAAPTTPGATGTTTGSAS